MKTSNLHKYFLTERSQYPPHRLLPPIHPPIRTHTHTLTRLHTNTQTCTHTHIFHSSPIYKSSKQMANTFVNIILMVILVQRFTHFFYQRQKFPFFCQNLQEFHYKWEVIMPSSNVFNLKGKKKSNERKRLNNWYAQKNH